MREDKDWLAAFSSRPADLLHRMVERGALFPLRRGHYVVAPLAAQMLEQAVPWQVLVDALVRPYGAYYIGYASALEEHQLTDLHSTVIHVASQGARGLGRRGAVIGGRDLRITTLVEHRIFGTETIRLSRTERYERSDLERTLVDCLDRPRLVGPDEVWATAWQRAFRGEGVDLERLCDYAARLGGACARRTGVMLEVVGYGEDARRFLGPFAHRSGTVPLDSSRPAGRDLERHPLWGVSFNVPRERLEGWVASSK